MLLNKLKPALLRFTLCLLGSIAAGYAYFGHQIFDHHLTCFQFILFGVVAGIFVAAWPLVNARWLLVLGILAYLGVVIQAKSDTPVRLIRDAVWVLSVIAAVRISLLGDRVFPSLKVGKFVVWAAIFAITHTGALFLLSIIQSVTVNPELYLMNARIGALAGAGIGLGHELTMANVVIWAIAMIAMVFLIQDAPVVKKIYPILGGGTAVGVALISKISKAK